MAVLDPLKVVITNCAEDFEDRLTAVNNPEDESAGTRMVPFSRELWIEAEDFREDPPKKYFRLAPGREVRLRYGYFITCTEVVKDEAGNVIELRCTHDPETRGGHAPDGRKVRGTLHWVSCEHAVEAEVRLYDHLFADPFPEEGGDFMDNLNPESLEVVQDKIETPLAEAAAAGLYRCQFMRQGYFCVDHDSKPGALVFNRTVTLRDTWKKVYKKG